MLSVEDLASPPMSITQLLNPSSNRESEMASILASQRQHKPRLSSGCRPSVMKIGSRREIKGHVNFPPCEESCPELLRAYEEFSIRPDGLENARFGDIASLPSSVPYTSSKKDFLEKTGRKSLEVFSYTFTPKGQSKEQRVLWDYNIGLVRVTPFFKSYKERKNVPKKSIEINPGLESLVYSVTGGQIQAQGYWVPFEAAKAIAATFCYTIRWALVPLFGLDFPEMCILPEDHRFKSYLVDPAIIERAELQAQTFLISSGAATPTSSASPKQRHQDELPANQQQYLSPEPAAAIVHKAPSFSIVCPPTPHTLLASPPSTSRSVASDESASVFSSAPEAYESCGGSDFSTRPSSRDTMYLSAQSPAPKMRKPSTDALRVPAIAADSQYLLAGRTPEESEAACALLELSMSGGSRKRSATAMELAS